MPSLRALLNPGILLGEYAFFVQRQDVAVLALSEYVVGRGKYDSMVVVEAAHRRKLSPIWAEAGISGMLNKRLTPSAVAF
ncbi:hypothetical protein NKI19_12575 [Mesorhizobium sp. M0751]|uniref:hypothetical protein n=1 Tax=unclassified Mesorhizobium TaxID=325217 RepID=UPI003335BCC9